MLSKLFKYEFKYTSRLYPIIYLLLIIYALMCRLLFYVAGRVNLFKIPAVLAVGIFFILIFATAILTIAITVVRFYTNMIGNEGYITFTLPAEPWKHILTKLLTSIIWSFASAAAIILSLLILDIGNGNAGIIIDLLKSSLNMFDKNQAVIFVSEVVVIIIIAVAENLSMLYLSMSLGQLSRHKILSSVGAYIGISFARQVVLGFAAGIMMLVLNAISENYDTDPTAGLAFLGICILIYAGLACVYFFLSNYLLSRKLNLE